MEMPHISIRQTPTLLGMKTLNAQLHMEQPRAEIHMEQPAAILEIEQSMPQLDIDHTKSEEAITGGSIAAFNKRVSEQISNLFLEALAERVQMGNELAKIENPENTIAEIVGSNWKVPHQISCYGPASVNNLEFDWKTFSPVIEAKAQSITYEVNVQSPQVNYSPGEVQIWISQYGKVEIMSPTVDIRT